jgi:hypothetical protein
VVPYAANTRGSVIAGPADGARHEANLEVVDVAVPLTTISVAPGLSPSGFRVMNAK